MLEADLLLKRQELSSQGYTVMDNVLPSDVAMHLNMLYLADNDNAWQCMDQVREKHYEHVFKTNNKMLPRSDEVYRARFWRSDRLETLQQVRDIFDGHLKPVIREVSQIDLKEFDNRCYKLLQGDFYRLHIDDYAGKINAIYYVNEEWIWDWGGILHVCSHENEDYIRPIFPRFNRLVLLHNEKFRSPHFISVVSEFAKNPRFTMVSFNK